MAKIAATPKDFLYVAQGHLKRVEAAWQEPDWVALTTFGLYCLEALVTALSISQGKDKTTAHWGKAKRAKEFARKNNLPDIEDLLNDLNAARKAVAYGDVDFDIQDFYDAEEITTKIKDYFAVVQKLIT